MPESESTFPRKLYNEQQDVIEADCQATLELALSRGWRLVPSALNTVPKLEAKIAEVEKELKELKANLVAKKHEIEIAMKAEEILAKMQADKAAKDAEAQELAKKQAAEAEEAEEKRAAEEAKAKAEAEVGGGTAPSTTTGASVETTPTPTVSKTVDVTAPKITEFGEKGKKK